MRKLKVGDIVKVEGQRHWIALNVTQKDIAKGVDTNETGIYLFGGMWYGNNPLRVGSYGKMTHPKYCKTIYYVGCQRKTPLEKLKILVG